MLGMDVFQGDAFHTFELTAALDKVEYVPGFLGSLGIFEPVPVRTKTVAVEIREDSTLTLVPTSPRGAPPTQTSVDKRNIRDFRTARIALTDTLHADEIQDIRAFGMVTELQQAQEEIMRRQLKLRRRIDLTLEHMRLGAIQGIVLDADGGTLINWFTEFGISQPAEIDFDLDNASPANGAVIKKCNQVTRAMRRNAKGAWIEGFTQAHALVGDNFWDDLTTHPHVEKTFANWQAAVDMRNDLSRPWRGGFTFGNITWWNYRGTDDNSTVAVGTDKAHFFPVGGDEVFQHGMSPGESFEWANTPGQLFYSRLIPDEKRNEFVEIDVRSYPLMACTRPEMLQRAKRT